MSLVPCAIALAAVPVLPVAAPAAAPRTYCNPIDIDYGYCPIPDFVRNGKHRTTADPVIVLFRGDYYLFSTNQWGYWWSADMVRWTFVPRKFLKPQHRVYDELCAPAAFVRDDALHLIGSTHTKDFPLWRSTNPRVDDWTEAVPAFAAGAWDPAFLVDDDGRLYLYHGSSNTFPLYGLEVDRRSLQPLGERCELIRLHDDLHGWERFGEGNDNTFLRPFIEGAWMTKHGGKYYLQYAAPGTEQSGYADGVYVGDGPLGPFAYQAHNPFSYRPGGFARGAGHGATYRDPHGNWWHTATVAIAVKNNFERRLGIWPAGFDAGGTLFCDTAYGDYPHLLPAARAEGAGSAGTAGGTFAGWMLLNHSKPVRVSSTLGGFAPNLAVDEDIRTYWSAATGERGEWLETDLGAVSTVRAVQVNHADQDAEVMGKVAGLCHQYRLLASTDGQAWTVAADRSDSRADAPHAYIELPAPIEARYIRFESLHVPTGKLALSGLRVFGHGHGARPAPVEGLIVLRGDSDRRNAWLKWRAASDATGYVIRAGVTPDKLYLSVLVDGASDYWFRAMSKDRAYYFQIESFNENGISERSGAVKAE